MLVLLIFLDVNVNLLSLNKGVQPQIGIVLVYFTPFAIIIGYC